MEINYKWVIEKLQGYPSFQEYQNVLASAQWACFGSARVDGNDFSTVIKGTSSFLLNDNQTFTPFEELTEEQVLEWCWAEMVSPKKTKAEIEDSIRVIIERKIFPIASYPTPWPPTPSTK